MKKIILGVALTAAASTSFAASYGPAGCGLGSSVVFPNASSLPEHVLAATTNGISGNQTFGMTSGTSGCEAGSPMAGVQSYMDQNMEQLAADAARGEGESLQALIALIGVEAADQAEFTQTMQANFDQIFASTEATSGQAFTSLADAMATNDKLAKYLG